GRLHHRRDDREERRLARAVGAEEAEHALAERDGDVSTGGGPAGGGLGAGADLEQRHLDPIGDPRYRYEVQYLIVYATTFPSGEAPTPPRLTAPVRWAGCTAFSDVRAPVRGSTRSTWRPSSTL